MLEPKSISFKFAEVEYNYIRPSVHSLVWLNEYIKNNYNVKNGISFLVDQFKNYNFDFILEIAYFAIKDKNDFKSKEEFIQLIKNDCNDLEIVVQKTNEWINQLLTTNTSKKKVIRLPLIWPAMTALTIVILLCATTLLLHGTDYLYQIF